MLPPANDPAVEVSDLAKCYASAEVLRSVTFSVAGGEIFGLLGRNGAGKTTTLECMLGLRTPDRGRVSFAGIDTLQSPVAAREVIGAQLQAAALQDKLTPSQALRYFGSFYARSRPVDELLASFQLQEKAHAPFDSLSGGQKQRLFLALAFVHEPAVVVLDEPTAGLDPQSRRELHACIAAAKARGVAIVLSTHDLEEADDLCDRVGILHAGQIVATGAPHALVAAARRRPRVVVTTAAPIGRIALGGDEVSVVTGAAELRSAPPVTTPGRHVTVIECLDVEGTLARVTKQLVDDGNRLLEVQIQRATLEDVFFEHTGLPWREAPR